MLDDVGEVGKLVIAGVDDGLLDRLYACRVEARDLVGLPTDTLEIDPDGEHFDGTVGPLPTEMDNAVATVRISAADPMVAVRPR